jgi:putative PEP-CTERM system histidine kinase
MTFDAFFAFVGALLCSGLAAFVFFENPRAFVHQVFAGAMSALALMQTFVGMEAQAVLAEEVMRWESLGLIAASFVPGCWLLFSVSFARSNYGELIARWKWFILTAFIIPLGLVTIFQNAFFTNVPHFDTSSGWVMPLGWAGYAFYLCLLLIAVVILMNLERTLRVFTGSMRWQIKFMILGLGSLFAVQIYAYSQALLFSFMNNATRIIVSSAIIVADSLIIISLIRHRLLNVDIYISRTVLYNSITVLIIGGYLLTVGVIAKVINHLGGSRALPLGTFFIFLSSVSLTIILLSDQLRQKIKQLISRHFYRSRYDYRQEWTTFTQRTTSLVDVKDLCAVVVKMVSDTFGVSAVTIWLLDDRAQERIIVGASTAFSGTQVSALEGLEQSTVPLVHYMCGQSLPVDFDRPDAKARALKESNPDYFRQARIRYGASLVAGQQLLGLMTLNNRLTEEPFSLEDFDLLKTLSDQAAASLLNLNLSKRLLKAKEMEAFQTLSAFFIHDLKNLASKLSLMVQNLPIHYDNPEFRDDMLRVISGSVKKMNAMCGRLSLLTTKLDLHRVEADLNELVHATLTDLQTLLKIPLSQELRPVPKLVMDPEQLQKVLANLILNANEAVDAHGAIQVSTNWIDGWVMFSVTDNGCGMSRAFMERSLFQPFQTTKSQGLGIGLFHSKMIVEAHQGRIEVESEEGKGSTFKVFIPGSQNAQVVSLLS